MILLSILKILTFSYSVPSNAEPPKANSSPTFQPSDLATKIYFSPASTDFFNLVCRDSAAWP